MTHGLWILIETSTWQWHNWSR